MADHLRKRIRAALLLLLTDANVDVGGNVFSGRVTPLIDSQLPAIDIDGGDGGAIETTSKGGASRLLARHPSLSIVVTIKQTDGYLDRIDDIYQDIEIALAGDNTLGGLCKWIAPRGEPNYEISVEGEKPVCRAAMPFEVLYYAALNAPDTPY